MTSCSSLPKEACMDTDSHFEIRQGGMGVDISHWPLANTIAKLGGLGTISGVMADRIMARTLQLGDPGGHIRRALAHFPFQQFVDQILESYFVEGGLQPGQRFRPVQQFFLNPSEKLIALTLCANFAFVWLAKEGHNRPITINYLEKVQLQHTYNMVGAMLAGVDAVTMGAGLPNKVPGMLDVIAAGGNPSYNISLDGGGSIPAEFDVNKFFGTSLAGLKRPDFIPIITTDAAASFLMKKSNGKIQAFVIERPSAGGHNAPPRGKIELDNEGEPIYGEKDFADLTKMREFGLPFWIGGGLASPEGLRWALENGASGIQVGSIFALSRESGLRDDLRRELLRRIYRGEARTRTDLNLSPTGFPFKVVDLPETIADRNVLAQRKRLCDQGLLLRPYVDDTGKIGFRCPAEPIDNYIKKGGKEADTVGAECLCNGLLSTTTKATVQAPSIITLGDDVSFVRILLAHEDDTYSAEDAMNYLLS